MIHARGENGRPLCMGNPDVGYQGHYVYHLVPDAAQSDCPACQEAAEQGPETEGPEAEEVTTHWADENGRPVCGFRPGQGDRIRVARDLGQVNCPGCLPAEAEEQAQADAETEQTAPPEAPQEEPEVQLEPPRRRRGRPPAAPVTPNDEEEQAGQE